MTMRTFWAAQPSVHGFVIFDDTVLDKNFSHKIELVRLQFSGNAHGLIKGIGLVNCVHVNPETGQYWVIDYRIYDPEWDGKSKLDHVQDMLTFNKIYYCPLKENRQVDDSGGDAPYRASMNWRGPITNGRTTSSVRHALEDRTASPRTQTNHRHREKPVPQGAHPA
jgi:hypothetical protein